MTRTGHVDHCRHGIPIWICRTCHPDEILHPSEGWTWTVTQDTPRDWSRVVTLVCVAGMVLIAFLAGMEAAE
jgi:hypothetical protein